MSSEMASKRITSYIPHVGMTMVSLHIVSIIIAALSALRLNTLPIYILEKFLSQE